MKQNKQQSEIIDLRELLNQYRAKWYFFVISVAVCGALALAYAFSRQPEYQVTANVLIDTGDNDPMASLSFGGLFGAQNYVDDEIFVLTSHSLYTDVARELGLDRSRTFRQGLLKKVTMNRDYPLDVVSPAQFADTTAVGLKFKVKVGDDGRAKIKVTGPKKKKILDVKDVTLPYVVKTIYGDFTVTKTKDFKAGESYNAEISVGGYDGAAETLGEEIEAVIANKKTHVIGLYYKTPDVVFGKELLNKLLEKYDQRTITTKNHQNNKTLQFLDNRISQIADELAGVESGLQDYKEANSIVNLTADAEYNFALKGEVSKQLYQAEAQMEIARMARDFISTPGNEYAMIPYTAVDESSNGVNAMISNYNGLVSQRIRLLSNAKEENYQVKNIEKQLDAIRGNIRTSLSKQYDNCSTLVRELRSRINSTQGSLGSMPKQERKVLDLTREQRLKQHLYVFLMNKREETSMMITNAVSKGVIVDEAFVPSDPVSMGKKTILAAGILAGLIIPFVLIYALKIIKGRPESRSEMESRLSLPVLGEVSTSHAGRNLVVAPSSHSSTVELFKLIRINLQFILKDPQQKVVVVTSSKSGEGKSFVSLNAAAAFALLGNKVLLVGMDIRKPMLAKYLGLPAGHIGITSYLSQTDCTFSQIVQHVKEVPGLDVVVAGVILPNPSELLMDPRMNDFFRQARENYDYIFIDSAPLGMVSDTFSVATHADCTIYVTRLGVTNFKDLTFIERIQESERLPRISVVINGTDTRSGYGYGYGYGSAEDRGKHSPSGKKGFLGRIASILGK